MTQAASPQVVVKHTGHNLIPDERNLLSQLLHLFVLALERVHLHEFGLAGPDLNQHLFLVLLHHHRLLPSRLDNRYTLAESHNAVLELVPPGSLLEEGIDDVLRLALVY